MAARPRVPSRPIHPDKFKERWGSASENSSGDEAVKKHLPRDQKIVNAYAANSGLRQRIVAVMDAQDGPKTQKWADVWKTMDGGQALFAKEFPDIHAVSDPCFNNALQ